VTHQTFTEILAILETAYGRAFSDNEQKAWWLLISNIPDDAAKAVTIRVCRRSPYPPKPADIVNAVEGDPRHIGQMIDGEAEEALAWFQAQFSDCEIVDYGPVVNNVVRALGGPDAVGALIVTDEWKFRRDEFRRLYKAFRRRGEGAAPPTPFNVAENVQHGFALPPPRLAQFATPAQAGLPTVPPPPAFSEGPAVHGADD